MNIEITIFIFGIIALLGTIAGIGFSLYIMYQIGNKLDKDEE